MPRLTLVAGARPNFIKVAPVMRALRSHPGLDLQLVHTGQHYDDGMSGSLFRTLDIPDPDVNLEVGSGTHAVQTARIMERFEPVLVARRPQAVLVFGDVNSTAACAMVAAKLGIAVVHVEAGLRSFDRTMPEEINRVVTDALSDLLLVSEPSGVANLLREGKDPAGVREVGNVMIDSLYWARSLVDARAPWEELGLPRKDYGLVTLHRPSNVDEPETLGALLECLARISRQLPLVFPVHVRTRARLAALGWTAPASLHVVEPASYTDSIALQQGARVVFTDSGGIQEEASVLGVPCLTLRDNTERPVTVEKGTSTLVGNDPARIEAAFRSVQDGTYKKGTPIPLWDGRAAERVAAHLLDWLGG